MTNEELDNLIEETYADSGLGRWFKEKWVDISRKKGGKHPPCGRSKATDSSYPKCRPSKKVSNKTPKTTKSMTTKDKKKAVNIKRRAEAPVSTAGAGRSPVMTKLKEGSPNERDNMKKLNEANDTVTHMYVFDFDDTIAETHSMIYVVDTRTGEEEKVTPAAFAVHDKQPHQAYDFREFEDVVAPKEMEHTISAFSEILTRMENAAGKDSVYLGILTARGPGKSGKTGSNIRSYLLDMFTKLLQKTGREDKIGEWTSILKEFEIVTLGANRPEEKSRWILDKSNLFPNLKTVVFYDDSVRNRNAFDAMKDELEGRGVRAAVYDPTQYTYDPSHLAEAEVEMEDGQKMPACEACLREYIEKHKSVLSEAKYQGREVPLGKPMKGDVKKSKVYVKNPATGKIVKVNFGDKNMKIKKSNPKRRKSFRARHNCENPGPKTKARYWSCKAWENKVNDDSKLLEEKISQRFKELAGLLND